MRKVGHTANTLIALDDCRGDRNGLRVVVKDPDTALLLETWRNRRALADARAKGYREVGLARFRAVRVVSGASH